MRMIPPLGFILFTLIVPARASEPSAFPSGPYCGVFCLQRAIRAVGRDVDIDRLIEPRFIGSYEGSSINELSAAGAECGVGTIPLTAISADTLRASRHPVLLHVAGNSLSNSYNHWVLFLGVEDGCARIYDPPRTITLVPFARLMSITDGVGLVVVPGQPADVSSVVPGLPLRSIGIILLGLAMIVAARAKPVGTWVARPDVGGPRSIWRSLRQAGVLVLIAMILAIGYDATNADGLLRNPAAVAGVSHKFFPERLPEVGMAELRQQRETGELLVLDARSERAYHKGHIPGAVNVPVTCGLFGHRELLDGADAATPICVYCQNDQCMWARDVALRLVADGYNNVSVFSGGWQAWLEAEKHDE